MCVRMELMKKIVRIRLPYVLAAILCYFSGTIDVDGVDTIQ